MWPRNAARVISLLLYLKDLGLVGAELEDASASNASFLKPVPVRLGLPNPSGPLTSGEGGSDRSICMLGAPKSAAAISAAADGRGFAGSFSLTPGNGCCSGGGDPRSSPPATTTGAASSFMPATLPGMGLGVSGPCCVGKPETSAAENAF